MRKIFFTLFFTAFLVSFVAPFALAQQGPQDCCKVTRGLSISGVTASKGDVVKQATPLGGLGVTCDLRPDTGSVIVLTDKWGLFCALGTIYAIIDWVFLFLIAMVVVLTIMGGFNIMMSGDPEKSEAGRNKILMAAVGLAIALIAKAVPAMVKTILGY